VQGLINTETTAYQLIPPDYKKAIDQGEDFYIQFHQLTPETESMVVKIIHRYLAKFDIVYIKDTIITIVKELSNNAIKANIKRLYFKLKNLEISSSTDYRKGMETFKEEVFEGDNADIFEKLEKSQLVVRVSFKTTDEHIHISVINNIPILDSELSKINARIKKAYKYKDISEAFDDVLDDSEGAGLCLIMAMMLYKNSGLPADSFKIYKKGELTIATISIPQNISERDIHEKLTDSILKEIDEVPAFPENITEIQRQCGDPKSTIKSIAESISKDPGLTTSILKLANSAGYITVKKIDSIEEAVKVIGIKGINTLLLATGVHSVIESKYKHFESLWKSSYKRAFYAQKIAIQLKQTKVSEFAYLAGLLSDIGKIIMLSINPDVLKSLQEVSGRKGIEDTTLLEEIALGLSHSTLGGLICKKWKFNAMLVKTIDFHHRPHMAPKNIRMLVYIVYLADVFVEIENRRFRFDITDEDALEFFKLSQKEEFDRLHSILKESYSRQYGSL